MNHVCESCGETFETLTALRVHDCGAIPSDSSKDWDDIRAKSIDWFARRQESRNRKRRQRAKRITGGELDDAIDRANTGDSASALTALAQLEQELEAALERNDGGDTYRDVYWAYYEPTAEALNTVARDQGWSFLLDVASAYDPRDDGEIPIVGDPVTNVIARGVIRTRLTDDIANVPTAALEFLESIPKFDDGQGDIAWEESMHYGWAIGHPNHDITETILGTVQTDEIWASGAAIRALYADQHAAVDLYADLLRALPWEDRPLALDDLAHIADEDEQRWFPQYWDVKTEFDRDLGFEFDESVERQLRTVVEDLDLVENLSDDWMFADLEVQWHSEDMPW